MYLCESLVVTFDLHFSVVVGVVENAPKSGKAPAPLNLVNGVVLSCLLRFLLPLLFKNFKLPLKMALLSPYAQFRIFSICIVVWKVLEYKHTSLRRRSSFEELKCLLLYNR